MRASRAAGRRPPRPGNALAGLVALVVPLLLLGAVALAAGSSKTSTAVGSATTEGAASPVPLSPRRPDIAAGEAVYAAACASCHPARTRFTVPSWREAYTPAQIAGATLGRAFGHPAAEKDLTKAWDVTAYVWTLPDAAASVKNGESLALEAERRLQAHAVSVALLHWKDVQDLKSASWVLTHTPAQVSETMTKVAGSSFTELPPSDRQDLVAYTFASYFTWPPSWR